MMKLYLNLCLIMYSYTFTMVALVHTRIRKTHRFIQVLQEVNRLLPSVLQQSHIA